MSKELGTNLTAPMTSFVGRTRELETLARLHAEGRRLVTLLGPGGSGKTRLAQEYGRQWLEAGTDGGGAWFCDLTESRNLEELVAVVAGVLAMPLATSSGEGALTEVGRGMAARGRILLILDNAETAASVVAEAVSRWLGEAPEALFLATSRQRLQLSSEAVLELGPLGLPQAGPNPEEAEAVRLFLERARAAAPEALSAPEMEAVARLVRHLDGLPLPIELAAARLRVMSPAELLRRISQRLDVLRSGERDRPPRHATIRAAVEWSLALLAPWERAAAAQASVFRGGFDLEAAESVLDLSDFADAPPVPDVVEALRDQAIVHVWPSSGTGDPVRFGMYEVIRAHAAERLDALDPEGAALARHRRYYLEVIGERARRCAGDGPAAALDRIAIETDNLEAVCRRALASGQPDAALRAVLVLDPVRSLRGPLSIHASLLDDALAAAGDEVPASLRAELLKARGRAEALLGRREDARASFEQGLALLTRARSDGTASELRLGLGMLAFAEGRAGDAARAYEEARSLASRAGNRGCFVLAECALGTLLHRDDQFEHAQARFERAMEISRQVGDEHLQAVCVGHLGILDVDRGARQQGVERLREALALHRRGGNRRWEGGVLGQLALLDHERGAMDAARGSYRDVLQCLRESGEFGVYTFFCGMLGVLEHELDRLEVARRELLAALAEARRLGERPRVAWLLGCLAAVEADADQPDSAASYLTEAKGMLDELDFPILQKAHELQSAHLELAEVWARCNAGDSAAMAAARDRARGILLDARERAGQQAAPSARMADEVLFAARALERAIDRRSACVEELVVSEDGSSFRVADRELVDLSRTEVARRLLARLAEARATAPGEPLSADDLVSAGWPGERIRPQAAVNRLHVALSTLRKLGLEGWVKRVKGGWLLDPDAPVQRKPPDIL